MTQTHYVALTGEHYHNLDQAPAQYPVSVLMRNDSLSHRQTQQGEYIPLTVTPIVVLEIDSTDTEWLDFYRQAGALVTDDTGDILNFLHPIPDLTDDTV